MKRASRPAPNGFTFVEVLVALLAATLLVFAASSALITSLRAEETAARLAAGSLLVHTVYTRACLNPEDANGPAATDWAVSSDLFETRTEAATNRWRVWMMFPKAQPSLGITLALREESADNGQ